jgi:hypothetical protein
MENDQRLCLEKWINSDGSAKDFSTHFNDAMNPLLFAITTSSPLTKSLASRSNILATGENGWDAIDTASNLGDVDLLNFFASFVPQSLAGLSFSFVSFLEKT